MLHVRFSFLHVDGVVVVGGVQARTLTDLGLDGVFLGRAGLLFGGGSVLAPSIQVRS